MKAIGLCVLWCAVAGVSAFAAESITITATPRYPWNGKVDLKFTIDGTSGTKYDTSFTAKDVAGGTNLTMKTLYKSNGTAANVGREALLPGTYNWVWDATADLTSRWPTYASCVPTSSTVLFKDAQLAAIAEFYAVPCGTAVSDKSNHVKGRWIKADGAGKSVQFAFSDDKYTKCVCVHFEQSGADVVGYVKWARYVDGLGHESEDFDENSATTQTIATSETASGYGLCKMEARIPQPNPSVVLDRVVVEGECLDADYDEKKFMIVDLTNKSTTYLSAPPVGGWDNEHKLSKLVFRKCPAGSFKMGSATDEANRGSNEDLHTVTISKPFYITIFELTRKQYSYIMGASTSSSRPMLLAYVIARGVDFTDYWHCTRSDYCWPYTTKVDPKSVVGKLRTIASLADCDMPTEAQWEYAARAGRSDVFNMTSDELSKIARWSGSAQDEKGNNNAQTNVGSYESNAWGIYDMLGNAQEWCLDGYRASLGTGSATDPKGYSPAAGKSWTAMDQTSTTSTCASRRVVKGGGYFRKYDNDHGWRDLSNIAMSHCRYAFRTYQWSCGSSLYAIPDCILYCDYHHENGMRVVVTLK